MPPGTGGDGGGGESGEVGEEGGERRGRKACTAAAQRGPPRGSATTTGTRPWVHARRRLPRRHSTCAVDPPDRQRWPGVQAAGVEVATRSAAPGAGRPRAALGWVRAPGRSAVGVASRRDSHGRALCCDAGKRGVAVWAGGPPQPGPEKPPLGCGSWTAPTSPQCTYSSWFFACQLFEGPRCRLRII